ncbi:MAG: AMP phosphorylase [Candidatus Diapherotrites archaeon]|nr:AMP phosphorylase [Candidatus Diapherotrites archaeon]
MERKFKARCIDLETAGVNIIVLNKRDAEDMDLNAMDRVGVSVNDNEVMCVVDLTDTFVPPGTVGFFEEAYTQVNACDDDIVSLRPKDKPQSIQFIKQKLNGATHTDAEIHEIIDDLMKEELTDVELTAWISSIYIRGLSKEETVSLTKSIVDSGDTLNLHANAVFDKHCIGGVAGNRTTMLVVPIIAAAGLTIPKTSSRAITSPAGTADSMEVLAPVSLGKDDIESIVNRVKACIVWGGAVNLAAADDKLIRIRHPLSLDPRGMLLASILAKKKAVGANHVIIDIPVGEGAKIKTRKEAEELARHFNDLGDSLGMNIHSLLTNGDHPIGAAVGPAIEAREVMRILKGEKVSPELREKSLQLAGILLELGGVVGEGKGRDAAMSLVDSGKVLEKMKQIIGAQGGDPELRIEDIIIGPHSETVKSEVSGRIEHIDNQGISSVVRNAGAPVDKAAGMYLHVEEGDKVDVGDPLFTVYARSERKVDQAVEVYNERKPVRMSRIILEALH